MNCKHERLCCTNNVFSCLDCGAVVPNPYENVRPEGQEEKPAEAQKPGRKRKAKGADGNENH